MATTENESLKAKLRNKEKERLSPLSEKKEPERELDLLTKKGGKRTFTIFYSVYVRAENGT